MGFLEEGKGNRIETLEENKVITKITRLRTHLSTPVFVTETAFPIQMAEPATGCYLKAVPCGGYRVIGLESGFLEKQPSSLTFQDDYV